MRLFSEKEKADCANKISYPDQNSAVLKAKGTLEPYRCPICGKWHLTTGLSGRIFKAAKQGKEAEKFGFKRAERRYERGRQRHDNHVRD